MGSFNKWVEKNERGNTKKNNLKVPVEQAPVTVPNTPYTPPETPVRTYDTSAYEKALERARANESGNYNALTGINEGYGEVTPGPKPIAKVASVAYNNIVNPIARGINNAYEKLDDTAADEYDLKRMRDNAYAQSGNEWDEEALRLNRLLNDRNELIANLTPEERARYNRLPDNERNDYIDERRQRLNAQIGAKEAEYVLGKGKGVASPIGYGLAAGINNFGSGLKGAWNMALGEEGETVAKSPTEYAYGQIAPNLSGLQKVGSDFAFTTGNMLPSIGIGLLTGGLGTTAMGISSAGNSYDEAINEGYAPENAAAYGIASGIKEAALQRIVGGLPGVSNASNVLKKALGKYGLPVLERVIKNEPLRNALLELAGEAISEGSEEYAQELLDPVLRNIFLGENNEVKLYTPEAVYAAIMGAVSGGMWAVPGAVFGNMTTRENIKEADNGGFPIAVPSENETTGEVNTQRENNTVNKGIPIEDIQSAADTVVFGGKANSAREDIINRLTEMQLEDFNRAEKKRNSAYDIPLNNIQSAADAVVFGKDKSIENNFTNELSDMQLENSLKEITADNELTEEVEEKSDTSLAETDGLAVEDTVKEEYTESKEPENVTEKTEEVQEQTKTEETQKQDELAPTSKVKWLTPKHGSIVSSTKAHADEIVRLAAENPTLTISQLAELVRTNPWLTNVLKQYINFGYGKSNASELLNYESGLLKTENDIKTEKQKAEEAAAAAEPTNVITDYPYYNKHRYGTPWVAELGEDGKVSFKNDVGSYTGGRDTGNNGRLIVDNPIEGKVYMYGQKDRRGGKTDNRFVVYRNGRFVEVTRDEALKLNAEFYKKVKAEAASTQEQPAKAEEQVSTEPEKVFTAQDFGLGAEGTKMFDGLFKDGTPADKVGAFIAAYNAGRDGKDINEISSPYISTLTDTEKTLAYNAGQMDNVVENKDKNETGNKPEKLSDVIGTLSDYVDEKKNQPVDVPKKKKEWSSGDTDWYATKKGGKPIAYSTKATSDLIGLLADENPTLTISELYKLIGYNKEAKQVLQAYINKGYGDTIASDWFTYSMTTMKERLKNKKLAKETGTEAIEDKNEIKTVEPDDNMSYNQTNNISEEGTNNEIHLRNSSKRDRGQNTGGPVSGMEETSGRTESRGGAFAARAADGEAAVFTYDGYKTAAEEGIKNAAKDSRLYFDIKGDTKSTRAAKDIAEKRGYKLTLFGGGNLRLSDENGETFEVRALVDNENKTMYVRADHERYTSDQLTRHEEGHIMIANGEISLEDVRTDLNESFTPEQLKAASDAYATAYTGTSMIADEIFEEVVCDSLGDMNIFDEYHAIKGIVKPILSEAKASANEQSAKGTRGPPSETDNSKNSRELWEENSQSQKGETNIGDVLFDGKNKWCVGEYGELILLDDSKGAKYSREVKDKKKLEFLDGQETITTFKTMQIIDGKLYPPMAAVVAGQYEDASTLGKWEEAVEHPELIKDGKFRLNKGQGKGSLDAAYNPYMHSSNLVLNDQFTGAYKRDNLVTVECEVPTSELNSGYHAAWAKDSVGWHAWHTGTVAGKLRKATGTERQVFLSRWIKPIRILSDEETAKMYAELLSGTNLEVPDNVVTPGLLKELKKAGVNIKESGRIKDVSVQGTKNSGRKVKTNFSMELPIEETKTLIALHNLTEDKLAKALDLGGFPMPSIAVTKADIPHTNFGDITLVMNKDAIDPEANKKNVVYSADAWTPTFPQIEYEADDNAANRIIKKYYELKGKIGNEASRPLYNYASDLEYEMNRKGGKKGIIEQLKNDTSMMQVYLGDNGKNLIEPINKTKTTRLSDVEIERNDFIINRLGADVVKEYSLTAEEKAKNISPLAKRKEWKGKYQDKLNSALKDYYKDVVGTTDEEAEALMKVTERYIMLDVRDYFNKGPETVTTEYDSVATQKAIENAVDKKDYANWLNNLFDGIEKSTGIYNNKDFYTSSGNRRSFKQTHYPVNLDNIVKAMAGQNNGDSVNVSGFNGVKTLRAGTAERFKSIVDMHAREGRLQHLAPEQAEAINDALSERMYSIIGKVKSLSTHRMDNPFIESDIIGGIIEDVAKSKKYTVDNIVKIFAKNHRKINNQIAIDIKDLLFDVTQMPVNIFEAKPERAVGFDEVLAAIIPNNASEQLRKSISTAGMNIIEYEAGNNADRLEKVNSVEKAKFSRELGEFNQQIDERFKRWFGDSEKVNKELLNSDGTPKVFYHGTPNGGFSEFNDWQYFTQNSDYADVYQNQGASSNGYKKTANDPMTYAVYLAPQNVFDTRNPKERQIFLNEFYMQWGNGAPLSDKGLPDWTDGDDLVEFFIENGYDYDAIILDEGGTGGYGLETKDRGVSIVVRDSSAIKSATDNRGTYDRTNKDIYLSRELPELQKLQKQNDLLRERVEYWKGQTKRTKPEERTLRAGDVDKLARSLIKDHDSTLKTSDINKGLKDLGEYLLRGDGEDEATFAKAKEQATGIASDILKNAAVLNDSNKEDYDKLKDYLKTNQFIYGNEYFAELGGKEGIADLKNKVLGQMPKFKIQGQGNISARYKELSEMWPDLFNAEEAITPLEQINSILDVLEGLKPVYENPYSYDMTVATEFLANDILDSLMGDEVRETPPTFADKQYEKLQKVKEESKEKLAVEKQKSKERIEKIKEENRQYTKEAIARERQRRDEKLAALKQHYKDIKANQAERKADSKARTKLLKIARRLNNKKLSAVNRALLEQYIGDLDTVCKSMTGKNLQKLTDLQAWYLERKETDPDFISDPEIERKLARLSKRHIADMTPQEVSDLTDTLLNIENELRTERKLLDSEDRRDIYHMGVETIDNIYNTKGSKGGLIDKFFITETLSPLRQVRRMIGYVDSDPLYVLTKKLADGQREMLDYQRKAEKPFEKFAADKAFNKRFSGAKADSIEITGYTKDGEKTVVITPAMRVSLYLHSLNDQNLRHIKEGGITVPDNKLYRKGKLAEAYARGVTIKLSPSQVREIVEGMTEKEKAFAEATRGYFNIVSKDGINAVSEKLKGYSLAQVDEYFPINTDTNFTVSEFESLKKDGTIEGMGFLKERVNAANPILLRDVNSVLEQSIRMHSKYVGLAIPVRNFNKVWNVTTGSFNEDGSRNAFEGSVQQSIKQRWGETGYGYVEKLMSDLQMGSSNKNAWAKALGKLRSNYSGAVLTLNLSVAMKQAASYPTAAAVLGWKPLIYALKDFGKVNLANIEKYTPLLWYRSKGFSTKELGDLKSANRQLPAILNWVQGMDVITTRKLWKACEYYVRQNNKDLTYGTEAFYKATADIYNRMIEETQPNYTTMQRPQLLRSDDTLMGNLMMFKTQPFQNSNILYDAFGNYMAKAHRADFGGEKEKAEAKQAKKDLTNAITSQIAQLATFAGFTMLWALLRGKDDKYRNEDGDLALTSLLPAIGKDMLSGAVSGIPFGTDAWELFSSKAFGDKYYGVEAVTVTALSDTLKAFSTVYDQIGRIAGNVISGEKTDWNAERLKFDGAFDDISKALGIPYENVINLVKSVYLHTTKAVKGEYLGTYAYLKLTTDPEKFPKDYYDNLYEAFVNNDSDYEALHEEMLQDGFTPEKIKYNMEKRMKDAYGVENAKDMEDRYLSPDVKTHYDATRNKIVQSEIWEGANQEQQDDVMELLYRLASESDTAAAKSAREKIENGAAYGVGETEYLLYKLALSVVDQPTESGKLGTYTNSEVKEAIDMLEDLSYQAKSYLWTSQGKSDSSNPYRRYL